MCKLSNNWSLKRDTSKRVKL